VPYLSALEVWSRQGAIQIHVYLYLYLYIKNLMNFCSHRLQYTAPKLINHSHSPHHPIKIYLNFSSLPGVHLQLTPVNLDPKIFQHPLKPLATPMTRYLCIKMLVGLALGSRGHKLKLKVNRCGLLLRRFSHSESCRYLEQVTVDIWRRVNEPWKRLCSIVGSVLDDDDEKWFFAHRPTWFWT